jgi:DsbC/DsbD-like thiol-disulfide interchange protein
VARREAADRVLGAYRSLAARAPTAAMALVRAIADRVVIASGGATPEAGDVTVRRGVATIDVFLERGEAKPGTKVRAAVRVTLESGWHVNAAQASRPELIPTLLSLADKSPVAMSAVEYPTPTTLAGAKPSDAVAVYEGTFWLRTTLSIPAAAATGPRRVPLILTFQPCDAATCKLPEEVRIEVSLRFGDDAPVRHPAVFR